MAGRSLLILPVLLGLVAATFGARAAEPAAERATAIFAGGCFWCTESDFDKVKGVLATTSGYIGGDLPDPDYQRVAAGGTGHAEAVEVVFDPKVVSYDALLDVYWRSVDPLDGGGQFCDRGYQYRTAIFARTPAQRRLAEESKRTIGATARLPGPVVTQIADAGPFYPAEDYHQDYYLKNPVRYNFYRFTCGRDSRLRELWGAKTAASG